MRLIGHRSSHPPHHCRRLLAAPGIAQAQCRLDVHMQKRGIVVERLLCSGIAPIGRVGITIKTARARIPQRRHALQRQRSDACELAVAVTGERERKEQRLGMRQLRRGPEPAVERIEARDEERAELRDAGVRIGIGLHASAMLELCLKANSPQCNLFGAIAVGVRDLLQGRHHLRGVEIGSATQQVAAAREEGRRRPTAKVVALVHVGPAIGVDAHGHEPLVDQRHDIGCDERRLIHRRALVRPRRDERQQDGLLFRFCARKRARRPFRPHYAHGFKL